MREVTLILQSSTPEVQFFSQKATRKFDVPERRHEAENSQVLQATVQIYSPMRPDNSHLCTPG